MDSTQKLLRLQEMVREAEMHKLAVDRIVTDMRAKVEVELEKLRKLNEERITIEADNG